MQNIHTRQVTLKMFIQRRKNFIQGNFHAARKIPNPTPTTLLIVRS